ncbi:MAG: hypothetical protein K6U74_02195 [Firmicutes bacterium]|nr:hypothetical protein [Bacillota bacterium]
MLVEIPLCLFPRHGREPVNPATRVVYQLRKVTVILFGRICSVVIGPYPKHGPAHEVYRYLYFFADGHSARRIPVAVVTTVAAPASIAGSDWNHFAACGNRVNLCILPPAPVKVAVPYGGPPRLVCTSIFIHQKLFPAVA